MQISSMVFSLYTFVAPEMFENKFTLFQCHIQIFQSGFRIALLHLGADSIFHFQVSSNHALI